MAASEAVQVVARCRPLGAKELREGRSSCVSVSPETCTVRIARAATQKTFTFDATFDELSTQQSFYEQSCESVVEAVLDGFNATIFAYGQTGCGKTHTMLGDATDDEQRGVTPRALGQIFDGIAAAASEGGIQALVTCSYLEIYNEEVRDLLDDNGASKRITINESPGSGVFVRGLTEPVVDSVDAVLSILETGVSRRTVGMTAMNNQSSRSHGVFSITVETSEPQAGGCGDHIRRGKLSLVDLAGSERADKTGATGARLKEGSKINLSLSALGNVISALVDGINNARSHIPYRDSKLTRLLQDSLGGNTKTLMVAAISPADYNYDETLSTLRYANRAKSIKNKPTVNEDPKDALLRTYQEEIERLKQLLGGSSPLPGDAALASGSGGAGGGQQLAEAQEQLRTEQEMRAALAAKLRDFETKIRGGAGAGGAASGADPQRALEQEQAKLRRKAQKLRIKAKREQRRTARRQRDLEEAESKAEESRQQAQDAAQTAKRYQRVAQQRGDALRSAQHEVHDLQVEFENERQGLLATIREQNRDLLLLEAVMSTMLPPSEVKRVWERSRFDEDAERWDLPPRLKPRRDFLLGMSRSTSSAGRDDDDDDDGLGETTRLPSLDLSAARPRQEQQATHAGHTTLPPTVGRPRTGQRGAVSARSRLIQRDSEQLRRQKSVDEIDWDGKVTAADLGLAGDPTLGVVSGSLGSRTARSVSPPRPKSRRGTATKRKGAAPPRDAGLFP